MMEVEILTASTTGKGSSDSTKSKDKSLPYLNEMIHCHVCGGKASGLHYGVYSCEGCKGFFRRTQRLSLEYQVCPNYPCGITTKSRNKCQYCRYEKCVKLGMSTDAVRMGRVPNAEKDKMLQEIVEAKLCSPDTEEDLKHQEFVDRITSCYVECYDKSTDEEVQGFRTYCSSDFDINLPWPYTKTVRQEGTPSFSPEQLVGPPKQLENHLHVLRHVICTMEMGVHKTAKFIKKMDELHEIEMSDRLNLFKQASLESAMVFFGNRHKDGIISFPEDNTFASGEYWQAMKIMRLLKKDHNEAKKRFFMKYNKLKLADSEKALFMLLIILAPDREDLNDPFKVEELQEKVSSALEKEVRKNHGSDATKIFSTTLSLLVILRELIPDHTKRLQKMKADLNGKLPLEPSPLMKEVLDIN